MARIPFRIDLVKPDTKVVATWEGHSWNGRVLCTDLKSPVKDVVVVALERKAGIAGIVETLSTFKEDGTGYSDSTLTLWIDEPETWILRRQPNCNGGDPIYINTEFSSKEEAQRIADEHPSYNWKPVKVVME